MSISMHMQNTVKLHQFILKILSGNKIKGISAMSKWPELCHRFNPFAPRKKNASENVVCRSRLLQIVA